MHVLCQQGMLLKAGHTSLHTLPLMLLVSTISRSSGVKQPWQRWTSLELPIRVIRDHELKVFRKFGNKLSAQGNNICSMEFAKPTRRFIVALRFVWIILQAHHPTCLKRKCIIPERLCHYCSSWRSQRTEYFDRSVWYDLTSEMAASIASPKWYILSLQSISLGTSPENAMCKPYTKSI